MLGNRLLAPSYWRPASYDSANPASRFYDFPCAACGVHIQLDLEASSNSGPGDEMLLGPEHAAIRAHFDFNLVGKSHDGGGPHLFLAPCAACGARYLVYLGVREPSNGHVLITVQGITAWTPDT